MRLRIQVAEDGTPTAVKIERSSGSDTLDHQAMESVRKNWRWPAGKAGAYTVPMNFTLK
ncbi:energy transducer TonB family protein [Prosthecobacter fluviatilis]|uniref:Energy transducer TonB n=1 Tax=Prosthecobacter fluviatilis TaxID=445931 RepID=A0ABW0KPI1_9BACT